MDFFRESNDEIKDGEDIIAIAVRRARPVGIPQARGNSASVGASYNSATAPPSGVTAEGVTYFPFLLDVDPMDTQGPYLT